MAVARLLLMFSTSAGFAVREIAGRGRGLVALKNIARGEVFWAEKPLAAVPKLTDDGLRCDNCFVEFTGKQLKRMQLPEDVASSDSTNVCPSRSCSTLSRYCETN